MAETNWFPVAMVEDWHALVPTWFRDGRPRPANADALQRRWKIRADATIRFVWDEVIGGEKKTRYGAPMLASEFCTPIKDAHGVEWIEPCLTVPVAWLDKAYRLEIATA